MPWSTAHHVCTVMKNKCAWVLFMPAALQLDLPAWFSDFPTEGMVLRREKAQDSSFKGLGFSELLNLPKLSFSHPEY